MAGFVKFDPWAFLEKERKADRPKTLAGLATLAGAPRQIENQGIGYSIADLHHGENQKHRGTPAKVAKVAKVELGPFGKVYAALVSRCPEFVPEDRWQQCVEDGRAFLAAWGEQAKALGWSSRDLFGLQQPPANPHRSYSRLSRYDATGLIWLLQGQPVVALTKSTAAIRTGTGNVLNYRKNGKLDAWVHADCRWFWIEKHPQ